MMREYKPRGNGGLLAIIIVVVFLLWTYAIGTLVDKTFFKSTQYEKSEIVLAEKAVESGRRLTTPPPR